MTEKEPWPMPLRNTAPCLVYRPLARQHGEIAKQTTHASGVISLLS